MGSAASKILRGERLTALEAVALLGSMSGSSTLTCRNVIGVDPARVATALRPHFPGLDIGPGNLSLWGGVIASGFDEKWDGTIAAVNGALAVLMTLESDDTDSQGLSLAVTTANSLSGLDATIDNAATEIAVAVGGTAEDADYVRAQLAWRLALTRPIAITVSKAAALATAPFEAAFDAVKGILGMSDNSAALTDLISK